MGRPRNERPVSVPLRLAVRSLIWCRALDTNVLYYADNIALTGHIPRRVGRPQYLEAAAGVMPRHRKLWCVDGR